MYPYPNGPFGNMMPYSDFHGMNLDWVIQITKDFLDQYTHIQDLVNQGIADIDQETAAKIQALDDKADALEDALDAWYTQHSGDIQAALTQALADFASGADTIADQVIASIPDDYTDFFKSVRGVYVDNTWMTTNSYSKFIEIPAGNYLCYFTNQTGYGFPASLGNSFYMSVSGSAFSSGYAYKTFYISSNSGRAFYTVCGGSSSTSNLPAWHELTNQETYMDQNAFGSAGINHFMDIPTGRYLVLLNDIGEMSFPNQLGRSFLLDVSTKPYSNNNGFKTYRAYANNSYAMYAMCGTASTSSNPPTWYELTAHSFSMDKWDCALDNAKLLLLGDSITRGSGATGLDGTETFTTPLGTQTIYTEGNSWAVKFTEYMAEQYPNVEVINHGWSGITIGQLATNIASFVPAGTTHCILGLGVNSEGNTTFDPSIGVIVKYLQSQGIKIFAWTGWLGTHPNMTNINTAGRVQAALVHAYHKAGVEPLCTYSIANRYIDENNLSFMDVMQWQADEEYVHPNDLGHLILYRIIREGFGF